MLILTFDATIWVQQKKSKLIFYDDLNNLKSCSPQILSLKILNFESFFNICYKTFSI